MRKLILVALKDDSCTRIIHLATLQNDSFERKVMQRDKIYNHGASKIVPRDRK